MRFTEYLYRNPMRHNGPKPKKINRYSKSKITSAHQNAHHLLKPSNLQDKSKTLQTLILQGFFERCHPDSNWRIKVLQTFALPLGYGTEKNGAVDGTRTRDIHLGKVALYQLSYYRILPAGRKPGDLCGRRDSNSYASRHQILSLARLPFRHARRTDPAKTGESDPLEIRTPDTLIKSQVLCQLS